MIIAYPLVVYNKKGEWVTVHSEEDRLKKCPEYQVWGFDFNKVTETIAAPVVVQKEVVAQVIIEEKKRGRPAKVK